MPSGSWVAGPRSCVCPTFPSYEGLQGSGRHIRVLGGTGLCLLAGPLYREAGRVLPPPCRLPCLSVCLTRTVPRSPLVPWEAGKVAVEGRMVREGLGMGLGRPPRRLLRRTARPRPPELGKRGYSCYPVTSDGRRLAQQPASTRPVHGGRRSCASAGLSAEARTALAFYSLCCLSRTRGCVLSSL